MKSKNLVVILTVGPETPKCVDWLNTELLSKKSTLKYVDVKTIEQSRGLEFPALLTISTEGKIAMELSEAHITGNLFLLYYKKSWALKIAAQNLPAIPSSGLRPSEYIAPQFLGMMTALTNTSSPELPHSLTLDYKWH